jgi:hypothetical protein
MHGVAPVLGPADSATPDPRLLRHRGSGSLRAPESGLVPGERLECVGRTGFEPVTSSVSGKFAGILTYFPASYQQD